MPPKRKPNPVPSTSTAPGGKEESTSKAKKKKMVSSPMTEFWEALESEMGHKVYVEELYSDVGSASVTSLNKPILISDSPSSRADMENHAESITSPLSANLSEEEIAEIEEEIAELEDSALDPGSDIDDEIDQHSYVIPRLQGGLVDYSSKERTALDSLQINEVLSEEVCLQIEEKGRQDDLALKESVTDENLLIFDWCHDPSFFEGQRETFLGTPGPTFSTEDLSPFQIFCKIWDQTIMSLILKETNKYGNDKKSKSQKPFSRFKDWDEVSMEDLWIFFVLIMLQSIVPLSVEKEYWYPCLPYLKMGNFREIMPFKKFSLLKSCLHFVDNATLRDYQGEKKVAKIKPIIDHLNEKFRALYQPDQNISIDESLLLWKGRLSFAQLLEKKAARVGIKSYELCESKTGYLWAFKIYTGKKSEDEKNEENPDQEMSNIPNGVTAKIVYDLVNPLLNLGHTLVMDNFYNSPLLSRTLKLKKTDTMGTLNLNREFVPNSIRMKTKAEMRTGEVAFTQTKDLTILMWKDSNVVAMISTYHKVEVGGKEKHGDYKYKPQVVLDYNLAMGGVDKKDQMLQAFPVERIRNAGWYKKLFRRLLNVSIYNAYILFNQSKGISQRKFRVALADDILRAFKRIPLQAKPLPKRKGHFPVKITKSSRSRCKWCALKHKESRTAWECDTCHTTLCIIGCFREYHLAQE